MKDSRPRDVGAVTEFLAEARDAGAIVAVLELSESFVRSSAFCPLSFDLLVLTGGKQINGNGGLAVSAEDLALERLREGGVAVVNADCPLAMAAADRAACPTLTFAMRTAAAIEAKVFDQQPGETTLMVTAGDTTAVLESTLTGPAMASCQLAAISLGLLMEYSLASVISSVSKLREVPGRVQRIVEFNRPAVVLDVCGSADRLGAVLRGLRRERNGGKLWVVAAVDTDLPASDTAEMGRIAERYADHVVVTTHPEQKSGFLGTAHDWLDGVSRPAAPRFIADRNSAFEWVIGRAESIDTVIIAGGWTVGSPAKQRAEIAADEKFLRRLLCNEDDFDAENPVILPFTASK